LGAKVVIRSFEAQDHDEVVSLWKDIFPDDPPWNEPTIVIRRKLTVQPELFLVGHVDGRLVATVLAGLMEFAVGSIIWQSVGHIVGKVLLVLSWPQPEEGLAKLGCPKVNLQVRATNSAVVSFYRTLGYSVEERASLGKRLEAQATEEK